MKRLITLIGLLLLILSGCASTQPAQVAATTLPVYDFTLRLCRGTGITVTQLITEEVSCLHDYSLSVRQVKAVEGADTVILSGAGLEAFMEDVLAGAEYVVDASAGIDLIGCDEDHHDNHHEADPHIWLSPKNAEIMAQNICSALKTRYPQHADTLQANLSSLLQELDALQAYGEAQLADLSARELITFHDGFSYFAEAFDLTILEAVEEESGSEASAGELKHLISTVREHDLNAVFTERNGSTSAANVIAAETGVDIFALDMAMSGSDYFEAMYHNIDTIKEALG